MFWLNSLDEMAQPIDVLSDDRGLRACMDGANVAAEWREALTKAHSISTLDDFIYLVTASEWEASLRDLVQAAGSPVKDNRIALARFKVSLGGRGSSVEAGDDCYSVSPRS